MNDQWGFESSAQFVFMRRQAFAEPGFTFAQAKSLLGQDDRGIPVDHPRAVNDEKPLGISRVHPLNLPVISIEKAWHIDCVEAETAANATRSVLRGPGAKKVVQSGVRVVGIPDIDKQETDLILVLLVKPEHIVDLSTEQIAAETAEDQNGWLVPVVVHQGDGFTRSDVR
jgi:hypothetical protein